MMAGFPNVIGGENMTSILKTNDVLDEEWVQLILEALEMGIDKQEISDFLSKRKIEDALV